MLFNLAVLRTPSSFMFHIFSFFVKSDGVSVHEVVCRCGVYVHTLFLSACLQV